MRTRGIPSVGLGPPQLREALGSWLEFSQQKTVPINLMIMANMYRFAAVRENQAQGGQLLQGYDGSRPSAAPAAAAASTGSGLSLEALDLQAAQAAMSSIPDEAVLSAIEVSRWRVLVGSSSFSSSDRSSSSSDRSSSSSSSSSRRRRYATTSTSYSALSRVPLVGVGRVGRVGWPRWPLGCLCHHAL